MFTWITFFPRQTFTVNCMNNKFIVVDWCEEIGKECLRNEGDQAEKPW